MKTITTILICFFVLGTVEARASKLKKVPHYKSSSYMLTYREVLRLKPKQRQRYFRKVAKYMRKMDPAKRVSFNKLESLFFPKAHATQYRCLGGGVPVQGSGNCGTSTYAGFTCPNNQEICNPLLFGLDSSGQPYCFPDATTSFCYQSIRTNARSFSDERFRSPGMRRHYEEFQRSIDEICSGRAQIQESPSSFRAACNMVQRQTEVNRSRNAIVGDETSVEEDPEAQGAVVGAHSCSDSALTSRVPVGNPERGSRVVSRLGGSGGSRRHCQILREYSNRHMPTHLTQLVPIQMGEVTICVMPDYLSLGTNSDFVRTPLGRDEAVEMAREMGFVLPTTDMVARICETARAQGLGLSPRTMPPNGSMTSTNYFIRHNETVQSQIESAGGRPGQLVGCHKKDLTYNRISQTGQVPIYGWHQSDGRRIQPLSTVHEDQYADYSHGIRMVSQTAFVNGRAVPLNDLLTDPRYKDALGGQGLTAADREVFRPGSTSHGASNCFQAATPSTPTLEQREDSPATGAVD